MPGRMTICNMTIEGGGGAGMIAPDERPSSRSGAPRRARRLRCGRSALAPAAERPGAASTPRSRSTPAVISPTVTWGTNPGMVCEVTDPVPDPAAMDSPGDRDRRTALASWTSTPARR